MSRRFGLIAGLVAFLAILALPTPDTLPAHGHLTAATASLMAVWWLTEAVPVAVTALLPIVVLPLLGVMPASKIAAPYASQTNFLFLGGLMIATALERWKLHHRIALSIIARFGASVSGLVLGFMVATAAISAWISNAATTMMMLPIAMAVLSEFRDDHPQLATELSPVLLLAVAYSATIGGMATIIGTPPNAVFVGVFPRLFPNGPEIGFLQWMAVGVPFVVVMIPIVWLYLVRVRTSLASNAATIDDTVVREQLRVLGPITTPERRVLIAFVATAVLWMFRRDLDLGTFVLPGWAGLMPDPGMIGDSTVAMGMALLLFVIPAGDGEGNALLDWESAVKLPWGVILLLGGGFALAEAIRVVGVGRVDRLAAWMGGTLPRDCGHRYGGPFHQLRHRGHDQYRHHHDHDADSGGWRCGRRLRPATAHVAVHAGSFFVLHDALRYRAQRHRVFRRPSDRGLHGSYRATPEPDRRGTGNRDGVLDRRSRIRHLAGHGARLVVGRDGLTELGQQQGAERNDRCRSPVRM